MEGKQFSYLTYYTLRSATALHYPDRTEGIARTPITRSEMGKIISAGDEIMEGEVDFTFHFY